MRPIEAAGRRVAGLSGKEIDRQGTQTKHWGVRCLGSLSHGSSWMAVENRNCTETMKSK